MASTTMLLKTFMLTLPLATSIGITTLPSGAQAIPEIWGTNNYTPPSGIGRPNDTEGGATRGDDFENIFGDSVQREITDSNGNTKLVAIVPPSYYGVTLQPYPEVFVYVGPSSTLNSEAIEVDFTVRDSNNNQIYASSFPVVASNQVIKLSIPDQAGIAPLKVGEVYAWTLSFYDEATFSSSSQVGGLLSRVAPSPDLELDSTTDWTIAKSYAQEEVWYDAISTLAGVYRENQLDRGVAIDLNNLLKSAGLDVTAENFPSSSTAASL